MRRRRRRSSKKEKEVWVILFYGLNALENGVTCHEQTFQSKTMAEIVFKRDYFLSGIGVYPIKVKT